jgi:hypothetical protein
MTEHEQQKVNEYKRNYYKQRWPKMILTLIPFKKPAIANFDSITSLTEESD